MVVKQILPQYARNREFVTMFIDEAKITVSLSHGNIVPVYELGQIDGIYFLSMDYVDGKNLGELLDAGIDAKDMLAVPDALFISREVLAGLDYAHRKTDERGNPLNIVHRDVSPQNVLISFEGEVKIVDFGIAHAATKVHATQAGVIKGKFGYMSPEQALGKDVDARSDIFTAGILLWETLTLERLFGGDSDSEALDRIKRADVPPPSTINPNLPPQLDEIVVKSLACDPDKRFQSAGEMQLALSRFLYGLPVEASSKTLSTYLQRLFAQDIAKRQNQPEQAVPPQPYEEGLPPNAAEPHAPKVYGEKPLVDQAADLISNPNPVAMAPSVVRAKPLSLPLSTVDEDVEDNFSYHKAWAWLRWLIVAGTIVLLGGGGVLARHQIARVFSIFQDSMDRSVERLVKKELGTLLIRSKPTGASVYFDNQKVGTTDTYIRLIDPSREYELVLTKEGYPPWSRRILPSDWQEGKMLIEVYKDWTADSLK
jgi:serine/threonine protein kinase